MRDGQCKVYNTIFSTKTHEVNIDVFKALAELGYIQIESLKNKNKSYLIFAQLGFGQFKEALEATKAKVTNTKTKKLPKQMQEIRFKITDKPVSFTEIYEQYNANKEDKSLKRLMTIIRGLENKNIDIEADSLGIARINYNAETSLGKRIKNEFKTGSKNFKKEYAVQIDESARSQKQVENNVINNESVKTL